MISSLKESGCDGVEVVTANSTKDEITLTSEWASEFDLLVSSGSDFHGWPNQRIKVGNLKELPDPKKHILNKLLNG
jgi:predicted metal-dependent phosphoesterase TrpH